MNAFELVFDVPLALLLLWVALRLLSTADMFRAVVLFVTFGLLVAVVWVRLRAPDVALAEAAIGAGLTGALFLSFLGRTRALGGDGETGVAAEPGTSTGFSARTSRLGLAVGAMAALLALALAIVVARSPAPESELPAHVSTELGRSGVDNPVTAVLLNFRGYDTLLELVVLFVALAAASSVVGTTGGDRDRPPGAVLEALVRLIVPFMVMVAGYLLWLGAHAPGGAFQGGAVLAAAGVLLILAGVRIPRLPGWPARVAVTLGPITALAVAAATMAGGGRLLEYPRDWAGLLILVIEVAAALSIAATLVTLFRRGAPYPEGGRAASPRDGEGG